MAFVVVAGQSNALGFLNNGPAPYAPDPLTYIWDAGHGWWVQMQPGVNTGTPAQPRAWGPEVAFAQDFRAAHPGEVLMIVKVSEGSTGLAADPGALDWSPSSPGELFDLTTRTIAQAKAVFGFPIATDAVLWSQGETDATDPFKAAAYHDNLAAAVAHMRSDWGAGRVEVARITDSPALVYSLTVRQAQWQLDQEDAHLDSFKTIGDAMQPDTIHYAPDGHLAIGHAYATLFDAWY